MHTPMGSSRPAFRDRRSSTRKEISRLPEFKSKTIVINDGFFVKWLILDTLLVFWSLDLKTDDL